MKTAIMGFGNPVRSDDAVGIYVVKKLNDILGDHPQISIFDMGTSAFEVLFELAGHQKIIMVDGVINTREPVGSIFKVPAVELMKEPEEDPMVFLHGMKWSQALTYAKKILRENFPDDIQVYLVAIEDTRMEVQLSAAVQQAGDKVVETILSQLMVKVEDKH